LLSAQNLAGKGLSAQDIIRLLDFKPHPEGGHFHETFRDSRTVAGERPQAIVPAGAWQAESLGDWTLCGCTVAPGF
jgi:predicted cupin superfamily sugar epimerase